MSDSPTVTLRTPTDDDLDMLFSLTAELATWEERSPAPPAPLPRVAWDARRVAEPEGTTGSIRFVVEVEGVPVGSISLFGTDELARHAELGIALVPEARGRGIGTEAIAQLVEFAFVRRNLRRVHLQAISSNTGGIRAYEKAGFIVEGRLRQHAWVRGAYEDIVLMGLLREQWQARARPEIPAVPGGRAPRSGPRA